VSFCNISPTHGSVTSASRGRFKCRLYHLQFRPGSGIHYGLITSTLSILTEFGHGESGATMLRN
jgi:hypothetical protein